MTKKIILILTIACMALSVLPGAAMYSPNADSEKYEYIVDDDGITITQYDGTEADVVIPSTINGKTVTRIGNDAFANNIRIEDVVMPDTVTHIGYRAFAYCRNLTRVELSENLTSIGDMAFEGCEKLSQITIPETVEYIGDYAFFAATGLERAYINSVSVNWGRSVFESVSPNFVIICEISSTANQYGRSNSIDLEFESINNGQLTVYFYNSTTRNIAQVEEYYGDTRSSALRMITTYNENMIAVYHEEFDESGQTTLLLEYSSDTQNSTATFFSNNVRTHEALLNSNNQALQLTTFDRDGETTRKIEYYDPETGNMTAFELYNAQGSKTHHVSLDSDGNVEDIQYYNQIARGARR